jgi:hypothetical protein
MWVPGTASGSFKQRVEEWGDDSKGLVEGVRDRQK